MGSLFSSEDEHKQIIGDEPRSPGYNSGLGRKNRLHPSIMAEVDAIMLNRSPKTYDADSYCALAWCAANHLRARSCVSSRTVFVR